MARLNFIPFVQTKLEDFSALLNGALTSFTLTYKPKQGSIKVYWNGVLQPNTFFSISNKTITIIRILEFCNFLAIEYRYEDN